MNLRLTIRKWGVWWRIQDANGRTVNHFLNWENAMAWAIRRLEGKA